MFKKPFKIGAQNQLSGKDRKTMRNKLAESFDQACVDKIFALNDKIISCKTSGSKMVIYNGNDYPLFVDGTGKNDYFPSLYVAIAFEPLVKIIELNEGVEAYIYNGANLMWPGVRDLSGLGEFEKDQVVGIRNAKGQLIAIGAMGCSMKQFKANSDKSGVAVYILHYFNDKLWESGTKQKPEIVVAAQKIKMKQEKKQQQPAIQKKEKAQQKQKPAKKQQQQPQKKKQTKLQQPKQQKQKQQKKGKEKQKQKKKDKQKQKKRESSPQQKKEKPEQKQQQSDQADFSNFIHTKGSKAHHPKVQKVQKKNQQHKAFSDSQQQQKKAKKKTTKKQTKKKGGKKQSQNEQDNEQGQQKKQMAEEPQAKSSVSSKLMDQQFKEAFMNALKLSKVQGELPIDSGRFYMDFMLLARPPGVKLQIKDTSYKKLGKFYEQMSKQKMIQFKHNKDKKGQPGSSIVKILWDNEQLKNYEPTILKMNEKQVEQKQQEGVDASKKKGIKLKLTQTLQVETAYKLHNNFRNAIFAKRVNYAPTEEEQIQMKKQEEQIKNQPQFYSEGEVRALIERYINEKVMTKKQKKDKKQQKKEEKKQEKQQKKGEKGQKGQKTDKMVPIDFKNNAYLAQLLKKQIEQFQQNAERQKSPGSDEEEKKPKKKRQHIMRIDRGALVNRILKTCSTSYHMRDKQTGQESFNEGTFKGIQLVAEKSNNKNITKIIGLEIFIVPKEEAEDQINIFVNKLKQKFACSVNTQNLPGRNAGKQIILHGNFISQLQDMFTEQYKINEDYITSQNKLQKKKKR